MSYERRAYESVDNRRLSEAISRKFMKKLIQVIANRLRKFKLTSQAIDDI